MPVYLLGEIEEHVDSVFVVAWEMDGNMPHPRVVVGELEIIPLIEALETNENGDSWEIAVEVNKKIRGEEVRRSFNEQEY